MLSAQRNALLCEVGPGSRMGQLLRRYWQPIAGTADVGAQPRPVRIMGEDLALYRDKSGNYGLVDRHCPHRRADMTYGYVEDIGLRCNYHGWLFDHSGRCLHQPFEEHSEAQFKTLKYRPAFPARFPSVEAARAHCQEFFRWYNDEHRHGGLGLHTAGDVHHGQAARVRAGRARVLDAAYQAHPERFVSTPPAPPELPGTSWINPPQKKEAATP